jgi:hypothetical protein
MNEAKMSALVTSDEKSPMRIVGVAPVPVDNCCGRVRYVTEEGISALSLWEYYSTV